MENPVVVFFDPNSQHGADALTLPIGWTENGERGGINGIALQACCVILLDDTQQDIPECAHANKDAAKPLLIVAHRNSRHHQQPTTKETLASWGKPSVFERFSHTDNEETFREIKALLQDPTKAKAFAEKRRNSNRLELLDSLAAICQVGIIYPEGVGSLASLQKNVIDGINDQGLRCVFLMSCTWQQRLSNVLEKAAPLAR